eukprot:11157794-Lingulodinium_polyedra.AAC.1
MLPRLLGSLISRNRWPGGQEGEANSVLTQSGGTTLVEPKKPCGQRCDSDEEEDDDDDDDDDDDEDEDVFICFLMPAVTPRCERCSRSSPAIVN